MESGLQAPQPDDLEPKGEMVLVGATSAESEQKFKNDSAKKAWWEPSFNIDQNYTKSKVWRSYTFRLSVVSVCIGGAIGAALFASASLKSPGNDKSPAVSTSNTQKPKPASKVFPTINFSGVVKPDGGVISIAAPVGDSISKVLVRENQFVRANQPIAELASNSKLKASIEYTKSYMATINRLKGCSTPLGFATLPERKPFPASGLTAASLPPVIPPQPPIKLIANKKTSTLPTPPKDNVCTTPVSYDQMQQLVGELPKLEANIASMSAIQESTIIRAPRLSRVLKVYPPTSDATETRVLLADTRKMYVLARVPLDNYRSLKLGNTCRISSKVMAAPVEGKLTGMGEIITPEGVDVSISIKNPKVVSSLSNLPVEVSCNV